MTSREFLNAAHAALVEEFMRPVAIGAAPRSLVDALQLASGWAEGFVWTEDEEALTASGSPQQQPVEPREMTEEEIVAQNNRTLAWLEGRMQQVRGGFATV